MIEKWGDRYCMIGPFFAKQAAEDFEPIYQLDDSPIGRVVRKLRSMGLTVHYGYWLLVTGKPKVLLFDIKSIRSRIDQARSDFQEDHQIRDFSSDELVNQVMAFGEMVRLFLVEFVAETSPFEEVVARFNEKD
jgi:glycogen(starch) synthase